MPHGLDHIAHAVHDLDAAADTYRRAGFIVGARNVHPWGTHNRVVQMDRCFIELVTVAEPDRIEPHRAHSFSFGAYQRDYLAQGEGLSMLLLNSADAAADALAFGAAGIGDFEVFDFSREGRSPDGGMIRLAFSLAFARDAMSPLAGFAACQHHYPENFWNPAFQAHPNGARTISAVVMVADSPSDHHVFLKAFTGLGDLHSTSIGVTAHTERGDIDIVEPVSFRDQYGSAFEASGNGARFAGLRIAVDDLGVVERALHEGGIASHRQIGRIVVADLAGATLIFEQGRPT